MGRSEKHLADQYGQERARGGGGGQADVERDTPRPRGAGRSREEQAGAGRSRVFREQPVLSRSTVTLLSQSGLERPTQRLGGGGGSRVGDVTGVSREAADASNTGSLTAVLIYLLSLI